MTQEGPGGRGWPGLQVLQHWWRDPLAAILQSNPAAGASSDAAVVSFFSSLH